MGIHLRNVVLDTTDVPRLAEFYRELLGWSYPDGFDVGQDDYLDWRSIVGPEGQRLSFQLAGSVTPTTWPDPTVPQQLHLDFLVDSPAELESQHQRALTLGAQVRLDRSDDQEEPLRVYADPSGHTFCLFTWLDQDR
ncbi:VOC family protein [Nocardioides sp. BP30]|uniref:VOC family protein n=1 Tax=Nocardioides sp. BP30 TaxID=3036374 RepID=UPI002468915E|nr:VOC family protein [Nocardioides sp. BP30]WGL52732.1 VOC family protein [Nocardioides sp. BP30]